MEAVLNFPARLHIGMRNMRHLHFVGFADEDITQSLAVTSSARVVINE